MKLLQTKILLILFISCTLLSSCDNEENANADQETLYSIIDSNTDFRSLKTVLELTGLNATLDGTESFTLFAPTNPVFTGFLIENGYSSLEDVPVNELRQLLLNHMVTGKIKKDNLPSNVYLNSQAVGMASGSANLSMYFRTTDGVTKINGIATVTDGDIFASNGVIHKIDHILELPTITDHIIANPNLLTLFNVMYNNDQFDFIAELSGTNNAPYTMMAPMNSAFTSLATELGAVDLNAVSTTTLSTILKYHFVIGANTPSSLLTDGTVLNSYGGDSFSIQSSPSNFRIKDYNNRLSNFTTKDIQCYNGIIHMTDKVLLPNMD